MGGEVDGGRVTWVMEKGGLGDKVKERLGKKGVYIQNQQSLILVLKSGIDQIICYLSRGKKIEKDST